MRDDLEQLRAALAAAGYAFAGADESSVDVRERLTGAGLDPSDDLVEWFDWVGGRGATAEVLPGWAPLPLEQSLAERAMFLQVPGEASGRYADSALLLADPVGHADKVAVMDGGRGDVVLVVQEDDGVTPLFDSLPAMVRTLVACWRGGGYVSDEGACVVADGDVVARAWPELNPVAVSASAGVPEVLAGESVVASPAASGGWLSRLLGGRSRPDASDSLVAVVSDRRADTSERRAALLELSERHPDRARDVLPSLLDDPHIRSAVVARLAELGHPDAVPAAIEVLQQSRGRDAAEAINALAAAGDPATVPALCAVIESGDPLLHDAAAGALGMIGDRSAVPVLRGLVDDPRPHVRRVADMALRRLGESGDET